MKVLPFKIPKPENNAIVYQEDIEIYFYDKLHQHEEIQLTLIKEGKGTLIVGDSINYYDKGDIIVIGSNIPHVFKSDTVENSNSFMQSLFFSKDSFGTNFFELEELKELKPFFKRSRHGFKIISSKKIISNLFSKLNVSSKFQLFTTLLELLKIASRANFKSLSSFIYEKKYTDVEGKRMRDVFEYTMTHFKSDISLETIASIATMTKNAFCKYFKKRTNKTYFQFLNELRIEHACKLLVEEKDFSIADIAYNSGYKNISNFNRQFKTIKKINPSDFKKAR
jgi:AraC-like DNA-binding protein